MDRGHGVVSAGWNEFASEISRWRDAGTSIEFWWRDDDATQPTSALERLLHLAIGSKYRLRWRSFRHRPTRRCLPLLPAEADVLQHGADHSNRAASGEKKSEYPASEAMDVALARLADADSAWASSRGALTRRARSPVEPNCRAASAAPCVLRVSGTEPLRCTQQSAGGPGVTQINTHVDIIDWKGSRGFVGVEQALSRRPGTWLHGAKAARMRTSRPDG
jgi:hypothetical protein